MTRHQPGGRVGFSPVRTTAGTRVSFTGRWRPVIGPAGLPHRARPDLMDNPSTLRRKAAHFFEGAAASATPRKPKTRSAAN